MSCGAAKSGRRNVEANASLPPASLTAPLAALASACSPHANSTDCDPRSPDVRFAIAWDYTVSGTDCVDCSSWARLICRASSCQSSGWNLDA